jgi:hypothetical protein
VHVSASCRRVGASFVLIVSLALIRCAALAEAQRLTGELSGTVVDTSGGVVPGADVTLVNETSGATRRTTTNASGFFAFAGVAAARYTLRVAMSGFNSHEVTGIELQSGDSRSVRTIALGLATVAERVSVSAETSLTPVTSGEKTATLTGDEIRDLLVVGTSAAEVLRVLPGMTPIARDNQSNHPSFTGEVYGINGNGEYQGGGRNNQSAVGNFIANGARKDSLDLTIDGASGMDPGCNCATSVNPNTEFVQELKVLQASYGAEHAKGPVALSFLTKQGGRDFHGTLFGQLRDWRLNSNDWLANKFGAERVKNSFVYPGFTLSGPLLVPGTGFNRNRDRVFFFLGFEYFRQRIDTGWTKSWVPTQAMRDGDFSEAASLGLTGGYVNTVPVGFEAGRVPSSQWDPGGHVLLGLFPLPNADPLLTGGYNYVANIPTDQNGSQALARVDASLSDATKLYARYNRQRELQPFHYGLWNRWGTAETPYPSVITGHNRSDSVTVGLTHVFAPSLTSETLLAVTYVDFQNSVDDWSAVSREGVGYPYPGVFGMGPLIPDFDVGAGDNAGPSVMNYGGFQPTLYATKWTWTAAQDVTKVWKTHTAKAGLYWERVTNTQPGSDFDNGAMWLWPQPGSNTGNTFADLLLGRASFYRESEGNALSDLGYDRLEGFLQDSWRVKRRLTLDAGLRISRLGPTDDLGGRGLVAWDAGRYSPTAPASDMSGLAWHERDASVPTTGVRYPVFVSPRLGFAWDVRGDGITVARGGFGVYRYADPPAWFGAVLGIPYGVRQVFACCTVELAKLDEFGQGDVPFVGNALDSGDRQQPRTMSWSLTLDRRLPAGLALEIGYVGSRSDHLMNSNTAQYNPVPLGAMLDDPNGNIDDYRPMPNYGNLQVFRHSAYQNYHALQALLTRQRGRLTFTAAYTFSKNLGTRGGDGNGYVANDSEYMLDPRQYNYGVLGTDRTHVATLAWNLQLPDVNKNAWTRALLGGWELAGVSTYVSGAPLSGSLTIQGTTVGGVALNDTSITGSPDVHIMPLLTCDPREGVPRGYLFNPSCFAAPTPGHNGSPSQPYFKGQPYFDHDLALSKRLALGSHGDSLQLRIAAYNLFNHPIRFPDPTRNLTLVFDDGVQTNGEFGRLPDDNKYGRRIVQLTLRYEF